MSALDVQTSHIPTTDELQQALTLGWTISELFGRLRRMPQRVPRPAHPRTLQRLSFANQGLDQSQRLAVAVRRVNDLCEALELQPPALPDLIAIPLNDQQLRSIHSSLEYWTQDIQIQLSGRSDELGRAFTYGGSFADTCWAMASPNDEAFGSGRRAAKELLRSYRVRELQQRMDVVAQLQSEEVRDLLNASLQAWTWNNRKQRWVANPAHAERFVSNLERQAEIWRELIAGSRTPASFVRQSDRQRASLFAWLCAVVLVLAVAVGLGIIMYWCAQWTMGVLWNPNLRTQLESELIETISTAVSLLSMLGTAIAAFVSRVSRLVKRFVALLEATRVRRLVRKATTVNWHQL